MIHSLPYGIPNTMQIIKNRVVGINYTLMDAQNNLLDASPESEPLVYLHGHENILPGLEKVLEGKNDGDAFTAAIPAAGAYGERDETLVIQVPLKNFAGIGTVKAGMQLEADTPDGPRIVTVTQVEGSTVTVDANHPLAGMDLTFTITVASVREASPEEISHGHPHHHGQDVHDDVHGHHHGQDVHDDVHGHHHGHHHCDGCGGCG